MSVDFYISESLQIEGLEKILKDYDLRLVSKPANLKDLSLDSMKGASTLLKMHQIF